MVQDSWIDGFDPDSEFRRATQLVNDQFFGMHLLHVSCALPETIRDEIPASAVMREGVTLPSDLVKHPALIAGSAITLTLVGTNLTTPAANEVAPTVLRSHIEMVFGLGTNLSTRVPTWAGGVPDNRRESRADRTWASAGIWGTLK